MPNLDLIKLEQEHAQMLDQMGEGPTSASPGSGCYGVLVGLAVSAFVLLVILAVVLAFANGV
jgi:hypothetical protein